MKLILIAAAVFLSSCNKHLKDGYYTVKKVKGQGVKFEELRRWYFINQDGTIKKGDVLFMQVRPLRF